MKRFGIGLLFALTVGGVLGALIARDPGYVLLSYANRTLEMSLWVFVLLLLAAYTFIRMIVFVTIRVLKSPGSFGEWNRARRERAAQDRTSSGLMLMAEGRWESARKELLAAAADAHTPLVNYLYAARAAHELGDSKEARALLARAREASSANPLALALTEAEIDLENGDPVVAVQRLAALDKDLARRPAVLRLLARCYEASGDDTALRALLPDLRATRLVAEEELVRLRTLAWTPPGTKGATAAQLAADWKALSNAERQDPGLIHGYARTLIELAEYDAAESLLRGAVSQNWDDSLVELYGDVRSSDASAQLRAAEGWFRQTPQSAPLLRTLGKLAVAAAEPAKAREYLEASLRLERSPVTYRELARLCIANGDAARGAEYLAQAAGLS